MQRSTIPGFGPFATRELLAGHIDWRLSAAKRIDGTIATLEDLTRPAHDYARVAITTARIAPIALRVLTSRYPLHLHVESESRDCDGRLDHTYTRPIVRRIYAALMFLAMPLDHKRSEFGGVVTVEGGEIHTYAITEEGYRSTRERVCADLECDLDARSQRDHTAESMGY